MSDFLRPRELRNCRAVTETSDRLEINTTLPEMQLGRLEGADVVKSRAVLIEGEARVLGCQSLRKEPQQLLRARNCRRGYLLHNIARIREEKHRGL